MASTEQLTHGPVPDSPRLCYGMALVGIVLIGLHVAGVIDPGGDYTFLLAAVFAVVATIYGLRRFRPAVTWPWKAFGAALVFYVISSVLRLTFDTLGNLGASRSLIPDLFALPGYVLVAIGLAGLAGVGLRNPDDVDALLDGVVGALAVLLVSWVYLVTPVLAKQEVSLPVQATLAAYPVMAAFVVALGARLAYTRGRRNLPAMWIYILAMFCMLVGEAVYAAVDGNLWDVTPSLIDVPFALALLAYGCATLHPSVRFLGTSRDSDDVSQGMGRLVSVAVALVLPAVMLLLGLRSDTTARNRLALGVIALLLVGVGVWRVWRALRQHAESQERLAYEATHDSLTGLPNRTLVAEQVARSLSDQRVSAGTMTLLHVDIDRFKLVNDSMGHTTGDELLVALADRLCERVRPGDVVGRLGGDEFVVMIAGLEDEANALELGERTRLMVRQPFTIRGAEITVTASVGIAFQHADIGVAEELIRDADTAVNHAKTRGGDDVVIFDTSMRERVAERLHLERELRNALARDELSLHFQPKLRLSDRKVVGLEALLRWNHPELGMVRPDKFIAIAEDTGMIVEIGAWVIDQACAELARLRERFRGAHDLTISVNVSARQLRSDSLLETIAQALLLHRVPPRALCLELTESILMENLELVSSQLDAIRDCGTRISIDDFGTGYSSLAYLSKLSVDELKIDRTFVKELEDDRDAASLIQAVVFIASSLGITSVAEGVETQGQAEQLARLGCAEVQGFLFARPLPPDELDLKLVELGMAPISHLRAVPDHAPSALGSTA
jgi:diguanylate cyclase (GGDEF)-like protein